MLGELINQFSLTRAALSRRAKSKFLSVQFQLGAHIAGAPLLESKPVSTPILSAILIGP